MKQDFDSVQSQRKLLMAEKADGLRTALRDRDPKLVAARSGSFYLTVDPEHGEFRIPFWNVEHILPFPDLISESLSTFQQTMLFYYLLTADGTPPSGKWVSFADLPDGRMYNAAFQGYTGNELVKLFGNSLDAFRHACEKCGGIYEKIGDASFIFQALPRIPLMVTYWLGDDEFPSSCKILFDSSASHYLPIDGCALLGSELTSRIMKASKI
ncbi:MAG: DUF3786 domain-containing protein [Chloroflexi bacterium]|nr:DUF3786 domain-containing protein [Chloroflexota bacterium]